MKTNTNSKSAAIGTKVDPNFNQFTGANGRTYKVGDCKDNRLANWCSKMDKPAKIKVNGVRLNFFANPEKSDYIYIQVGPRNKFIWAKQDNGFDVLKEKSLGTGTSKRTRTVKAKAEVKVVTKAIKGAAKTAKKDGTKPALKPRREVKVIKKADVIKPEVSTPASPAA